MSTPLEMASRVAVGYHMQSHRTMKRKRALTRRRPLNQDSAPPTACPARRTGRGKRLMRRGARSNVVSAPAALIGVPHRHTACAD